MQISPIAIPILSMPISASVSAMSDPSLGGMQERLTALRTGTPAINISGIEAQGNVQFSTAENVKIQERWSTPANMTLPYPGLDGHPRRIVPIPVSVNMTEPAIEVRKSSDQIRQETADLINRLEN